MAAKSLLAARKANENDSYRIPTGLGTFLAADPIKFCLRFKPPTIAIVY